MPTSGVKKKQVTNPFQNVTPSRSILFAVIAQAMIHKRPTIPINSQKATNMKCACENILAPQKVPAALVEAPISLNLIVDAVAKRGKGYEKTPGLRVNSNW
jgi:hypothetical protein